MLTNHNPLTINHEAGSQDAYHDALPASGKQGGEMMASKLNTAQQLYGDPDVIPLVHLVPGVTVCLVSNPNKVYGVIDRRGPLVELESEHGRRFKVGFRALRWPASKGGEHEQG